MTAACAKVIVIGLDGLSSTLVGPMLQRGELPNLAKVRDRGSAGTVRTTYPAQTPVAWSTFATGLNPGGHGIFDFIRRDPTTYMPDLSLVKYDAKNAFVGPKAVNLRSGKTLWELLDQAGVPSSVIRCPCSFPPEKIKGRVLSGMGVPDLRGGLGTGTFYTSNHATTPGEGERVVHWSPASGAVKAELLGPKNAATRKDLATEFTLAFNHTAGTATLTSPGEPRDLPLRVGAWSDWLRIKFKSGALTTVAGMARFWLRSLSPHVELYASPVNFDPRAPMFPISHPADFAKELMDEIGPYYTTGMVEDHNGLESGRISEDAFLQQCEEAFTQRQKMLMHELGFFKEGLLYCLFDTPDRIQHMFWRFREPDHPANTAHAGEINGKGHPDFAHTIEDHYRRCDRMLGDVLRWVDDKTMIIVLSDHGFGSFRRGVALNAWLAREGLLAFKHGHDHCEALFDNVDWSRTHAYAVGIGSLYINRKGRERDGIVAQADEPALLDRIATGLSSLTDRGAHAVHGVGLARDLYRGERASDAPDMIVRFAPGYRASWSTCLGGVPHDLFEDNARRWSGDHIVDPEAMPGVLFANRPLAPTVPGSSGPRAAGLEDLAPTICAALGVPASPAFEGRSLLR